MRPTFRGALCVAFAILVINPFTADAETLSAMDLQAMRSALTAVQSGDWNRAYAELASVGVPVLLVHGRDDRVVPWRPSSGQLLDLLPDSRLHVLSGCGHWTMIEKTADFLAVVLPFLAE